MLFSHTGIKRKFRNTFWEYGVRKEYCSVCVCECVSVWVYSYRPSAGTPRLNPYESPRLPLFTYVHKNSLHLTFRKSIAGRVKLEATGSYSRRFQVLLVTSLLNYPEAGGRRHLRSVGNCVPMYTASYVTRLQLSSASPREPKISDYVRGYCYLSPDMPESNRNYAFTNMYEKSIYTFICQQNTLFE